MEIQTGQLNNNKTRRLSFTFIQQLKNNSRFWQKIKGNDLFIFDCYTGEIITLSDNLRDLVLAEDYHMFENVKVKCSEHELKENYDFFTNLFNIPDEPLEITRSRTKINVLKLNCSTICNLACSYCFRKKNRELILKDQSMVFRAIDYMLTDCGREASAYTVCFDLSSEPLLQQDLLAQIHKYINIQQRKTGKKIELFFITNGTICTPQTLKLLKKVRKNRNIAISLDGPAAIQDLHRTYDGHTGTYEEIRHNIDLLLKKRFFLAAETVLTNQFPDPLNILKHLLNLGFTACNLKPVRQGTPYSFDLSSLEQLKKGYDKYFAFIINSILNDDLFILKAVSKDYALRPFWRILFHHKMALRCNWGIDSISMDYRGDFYPCDSVMHLPEYKIGSVNKGIDWDKYHMNLNNSQRGQCKTCWARYICGGTCYVNGIILDNDPMMIDPVECSLSKFLIEKNLEIISILIQASVDMDFIKRFMGFQLYKHYIQK